MIAEPYICIKGGRAGDIQWTFNEHGIGPDEWQPYAAFEREKLKELDGVVIHSDWAGKLTFLSRGGTFYDSGELIGYSEYLNDSESNRLLKRAEFLKAVCEKEGVEWLPEATCNCNPRITFDGIHLCGSPFPQFANKIRIEETVRERDYYTKAESEEASLQLGREIKSVETNVAVIADALLWIADAMEKEKKFKNKPQIIRGHAETVQRRMGIRK